MGNKNKITFLAIFLLFFTAVLVFCDEKLAVGSVVIKPELTFDFYSHKLGDGWSFVRDGYKSVNYNYTYTSSNSTANEWKTVSGQTLLLDVSLKPRKNFYADFGFRFINNYADRFWQPINIDHRLYADGKSYSWDKADVKYNFSSKTGLQYLRGVGHETWKYSGDLFSLFPEQYETERYLRLAGYPIPDEWKLNVATRKYGSFQLIYGPEVIWDYKNGVYLNYSFNIPRGLKQKLHLIYRDHIIPYGDPDERMRSVEVSSKFSISENNVELGILYQPFRVNRDYVCAEDAAPGTGIGGSNYDKAIRKTKTVDAFGYSTKLDLKKNVAFDMLSIQYSFLGLVAGNKQEIKTHINRKLHKQMTLGFDYTYRKPLLGPVPLVYENVNGILGSPVLQPRGPESPFWVGWGDPGTGDNREASILSAVFTYDPTLDTWFYRNDPDSIDEYNLNPNENSMYSFAAVCTLTRYPTSTDRLIYKDELNNIKWDAAGLTGAWPTDGYLSEFTLLNRFNFKSKKIRADLKLSTGDSLATNSSAYNTATSKPITNYFISSLTLKKTPYSVKVEYDHNYWGPELWLRQFGETFDNLYKIDINRSFGEYISAGLGYTGAKQNDRKYVAPELGDYDEVHCYFVLKFGPIKADFKEKSARSEHIYGIRPNLSTTPPQVSLSLTNSTFSPSNGEVLGIRPLAMSVQDIYEWKIIIKNSSGILVKTFSGEGQPSSLIEWDGRDDNNLNARQDTYVFELEAVDGLGNSSSTEPIDVYLARDVKTIKY
ncbi:MAG: hypothetical protein NT145_08030 [Elusimicrobia bacterium]|nr:hypothetical protein [Elusimicrobiota bacterium]